ncbi:DEAD/DEAH box helicase family protein [Treponema berlinense]|uniref:DEAD/DEAH box helicase family protein n=1 Tax=Treponema berlinense TaxID=225004 RepID=UPI003FD7F241
MLYEKIQNQKEVLNSEDYEIPSYITENLKYELFDWQREALENFLINERTRNKRQKKGEEVSPNHLMFNMATGSGKTLVMAALILYYYKEHKINNFIFFVNQNAILGKTQDNFINKNHQKYLFKENIIIDEKRINIKEVEQFSSSNDIQIKFTTIQKLHNDIYKESESSLLLSDLQKRNLVLLADEAHHLNATTNKKKNKISEKDLSNDLENSDFTFLDELKDGAKEEDLEKSWETTICHFILNKENKNSSQNKNALLEFTATIPETPEAKQKYEDKIIIQFDLKKFVEAGFTKHIRLVRSSLNQNERILQALVLNWYRSQIALKYNIPNFKPVILFRSKTIEESNQALTEFLKLCSKLKEEDLNFLENKNTQIPNKEESEIPQAYDGTNDIFEKIKFYIQKNKIPLSRIVDFIKDNFTDRTCLITNSKTNKTKKEKTDAEQDKLLNSLENPQNPIRAVFTVQRLTEGWDVLNLYDSVRLYKGRDTDFKNKKAGTSTTSEVQLIGRGVRYFPFEYGEFQKNKRKFDSDLNNEVRVLEEFYFHSDNDVKYLSELTNELKNKGLIDDKRIQKKFCIKEENQKILKKLNLLVNEKKENPNRRLKTLPDDLKNLIFEDKIYSHNSQVYELKLNEENQTVENKFFFQETGEWKTLFLTLNDFPLHILQKAIHILNSDNFCYFTFENLQKRFEISSLNDFFDYLNEVKINLFIQSHVNSIKEIENKILLQVAIKFFKFCQNQLEQYDKPFIGTDFKFVPFEKCFSSEKIKMLNIENAKDKEENLKLENELKNLNWYALNSFWGTDEERALVNFIKLRVKNLEEKYEVCLLRNEEVYKIFSFESGEGFCPDFLLLLKDKKSEKANLYFQVFIEPKGKQLLEKDEWKENFLLQIEKKYGIEKPFIEKNEKFILMGLPFFSTTDENKKVEFENAFGKL